MLLRSTPTPISVNAPGNTALSMLAASMPAGTWAKLDVANQDAMLGVGSISGSMIHYCNSMPWNSRQRVIEIIGMDHDYGSVRYVQYNEASNQFVLITNDLGFGTATQHGYDHNNINPHTGDYFHRRCQTGEPSLLVSKKPVGSATGFVDLPTVPTNYEQVAIGSCYWSGAFTGAGTQGCFMLFNSGDSFGKADDGQIAAFDPLTNTWFWNQHGMAPFFETAGYTYHSVMEYSTKKNVAVYGGGGDAPTRLWRLASDRSVLAMPNTPSGKEVGIQHGILTEDPVTGNFLLLSAGELWELDPDGTGTWTRQTGTRSPPDAVGIPGPSPTLDGMICCSISDYGVVAYIKQTSPNNSAFHLYKHA
jgi:hypothetical protein